MENLIILESLLDFTTRGIEEHLKHDEPEPDRITAALEGISLLIDRMKEGATDGKH